MLLLDQLAEQRIDEALKAGAFDNLPGAGQPLPEEDWTGVPEEERAAYRLLKNAGYLPPELEMHREALSLAMKLAAAGEGEAQMAQWLDRLSRINLWLAEQGRGGLVVPTEYLERLARRCQS